MTNFPSDILELVNHFLTEVDIPDGKEVLVQAQRIKCERGGPLAKPAVEGFHCDGIDFLGILCVERAGIVGGVTLLSTSPDGSTPVLETTLLPGQMLVLDDRSVFHYTTPVHPKASTGHRDVILLCTPACRMSS